MADLVKKIKIKKQDGTFTDYIPIGAEALNINMNNNRSVQENIGDIDINNQGNVAQQLSKINKRNKEAEFIFPKSFENSYSGDCSIIRYDNKVIMIDTYSSTVWTDVKNFIDDFDIDHIDYCIITHYHGDHVGNFKNLVENGYIDSETKLYFPAEVTLWSSYSGSPAHYQNYCIEHNLTYNVPTEYEELVIDELKLTFFNCDPEILDELYYTNSTVKNYNNCSTAIKVNHRSVQALFTGDMLAEAIQRVYNEHFIKGRLNFYKVEHHGIEPTANKDFIDELCPMFAYQPSGILDYQKKVLFANCQIGKFLDIVGCKNYIMFQQQDYPIFVSDGDNFSCIQGTAGKIAYRTNEITYYVDKNATQGTFSNGTQEYPFNEINQAFGVIENNPCEVITINLADGVYGVPELEFRTRCSVGVGHEATIVINGNSNDKTAVVLNGVMARDANITLNNLTINVDNYEGLYAYNSKIKLNNVNITSVNQAVSSHSCLILRDHSYGVINNCFIDYGNEGIIATDSIITISNLLVGEHINSSIFNINYTNICRTYNITYVDENDKTQNKNHLLINSPQLLFIGDEYSEVTLPKSVSEYGWIEIMYQDNNSTTNIKSTGRLYYPNNKAVFLNMEITGSDGKIYFNNARCGISNNKLTLTRNSQIAIDTTDGTLTFNDGNYIKIIRVICGWVDYVDCRSTNS